MWFVNKRFLSDDRFVSNEAKAKMQAPTPADAYILQDTDHFRTLNLGVSTFNDASTSYFHKSIGGYHGAKIKRYQELIDYTLSKEIAHIARTANDAQTIEQVQTSFNNTPGLNMLNANITASCHWGSALEGTVVSNLYEYFK
jgi:hypothetical protein